MVVVVVERSLLLRMVWYWRDCSDSGAGVVDEERPVLVAVVVAVE